MRCSVLFLGPFLQMASPTQILSTHPDRPERIEPYQLRHYASFYSSDALAINHYSAMRTVASRGVPRLYLPPLHAKELLTLLSAADITNVASLLISVAEYNVPREVCCLASSVNRFCIHLSRS